MLPFDEFDIIDKLAGCSLFITIQRVRDWLTLTLCVYLPMTLLLNPRVDLLVIYHPVRCLAHQELRLWSLTLSAGSELSKLCIALGDNLDQILLPAVVNRGILLKPLFPRRLWKWFIMKQGWLLEHHLVWCVYLYDFLTIWLDLWCVWIVKFKYSAMRYGLGRRSLCINCRPRFELVFVLCLTEPQIADGLESRNLRFMTVVAHLSQNIRIYLGFIQVRFFCERSLAWILLRHYSDLDRIQIDFVSLRPLNPPKFISFKWLWLTQHSCSSRTAICRAGS